MAILIFFTIGMVCPFLICGSPLQNVSFQPIPIRFDFGRTETAKRLETGSWFPGIKSPGQTVPENQADPSVVSSAGRSTKVTRKTDQLTQAV
jgi:hypothetical protein